MSKAKKKVIVKKTKISKKTKPSKRKKILIKKKIQPAKIRKAAVSPKKKKFKTATVSKNLKSAKSRKILVKKSKKSAAKAKLFKNKSKKTKKIVKKVLKIKKLVSKKHKKTIKHKKKIKQKPIKRIAVPTKKKIKIISTKKSERKKKKKIISKHPAKLLRKKIPHKKVINAQKIITHPHARAGIGKRKAVKMENAEFPAESLFKAKIRVIGIGGGGGSIVSEMGKSLEKATFIIADTDIRALKKKSGIKYFWFGGDLTHGLGTGVNVDLGKQAAESVKEKMSGIFQGQDIIIFVASLGGGLGSGATQIFAEAARKFGGITLGIFTMPFKFEGKNKYRIAQNALKSLRRSLNVSLIIPNERIFKVIDNSTPITNAFSIVNKRLIESLESLIDLIYNPGIINIDFADLRTILNGRGNSAFLNTVELPGKDKVDKICENIFKNPLLQNNNFKAEKILFNIAGGEDLSMFQVEKISSHIANLNPKAKIIFGISKNSRLKNKIKTTILMTGASPGIQIKDELPDKIMVKKIEPAKAVASNLPIHSKQETINKRVVKIKKEKKSLVKVLPSNAKPVKIKNPDKKEEKPVSLVPVLEMPVPIAPINLPILEQKRLDIAETASNSSKKTIRRSGLEIKKAEELQEKKRIAQEKEWEIPAFLRKVKIKS